MLIFGLEKERQPPCQDSIEGSIKESRLLNGFANDGCAGQVALECHDKGWCCIYPEDMKSFVNQHRRGGKAGPATEINDGGAAQERSRPLSHLPYANSRRPTSTGTTRKKFFRDCFVSIGSIHLLMVASRPTQSINVDKSRLPSMTGRSKDAVACCNS